jgi:hypothetical protein
VTLLAAGSAIAEPSPAELAKARRLFEEATAFERQQSWRAASTKLDAALAIKETPGLHFHRAHCAEQLGELVVAARHYARSEELIRAGHAAPDVEDLLEAARSRVLARVPRLVLVLPSDVVGTKLEIDGMVVNEPAGTPVFLDPGRHRVIARAPGRRDFEMEITLVEGQTQTLEVSLAPPREAHSPSPSTPIRESQPATEPSDFGTREVVLIAGASVAVAGLAAGIGFSFARGSATERIERAQQDIDAATGGNPAGCSSTDAPAAACDELQSALDDHDRTSRFATIGFVTAGVGTAAALLTWTLWPSTAGNTTASVAPTSGGATLAVSGRF